MFASERVKTENSATIFDRWLLSEYGFPLVNFPINPHIQSIVRDTTIDLSFDDMGTCSCHWAIAVRTAHSAFSPLLSGGNCNSSLVGGRSIGNCCCCLNTLSISHLDCFICITPFFASLFILPCTIIVPNVYP